MKITTKICVCLALSALAEIYFPSVSGSHQAKPHGLTSPQQHTMHFYNPQPQKTQSGFEQEASPDTTSYTPSVPVSAI